MGIFTKDIKSMEDLLVHGLQDIYYPEQQILKSLPKTIDKATNRDLVAGLKVHREETTNRSSGSRRRSFLTTEPNAEVGSAVSSDPEFSAAIAKFYGGQPDQRTLDLLLPQRT
jgi:hypothetical protein